MVDTADARQAGSGRRPAPASPGHAAGHFACFDGLRAVAAWAVVFHHVGVWTSSTASGLGGQVLAGGDIGVTIFFLISGFLLYRPFAAAHARGHGAPRLAAYFSRRFLRIFPAYWLALAGAVFVLRTAEFWGPRSVLSSVSLTFVYFRDGILGPGAIRPVGQAWSLCVELTFYLFLPLYAWAVRRLAARVRRPLAAELAGIVTLLAVGIVVDWFAYASPPAYDWRRWIWFPRDVDLFAFGMLLALWSTRPAATPRLLAVVNRRAGLCWAGAAAFYLVAVTRTGIVPASVEDIASRAQLMSREFLYTAVAFLLLLPAVTGDQHAGRVRGFLRHPVTVWLGLVSYGIYLWHLDVVFRWIDWFEPVGRWRFFTALVPVALGTVAFAAASYYLLERPALRLKHRLPFER